MLGGSGELSCIQFPAGIDFLSVDVYTHFAEMVQACMLNETAGRYWFALRLMAGLLSALKVRITNYGIQNPARRRLYRTLKKTYQ